MATVFQKSASSHAPASPLANFINDERNRSIFYQILVFGLLAWVFWYLFTNTAHNLESRGMSSGFDFLGSTAGFNIAWSIIPYEGSDTYGKVYLVGITNTLLIAFISIIATTVLGFFVGILRLSHN